ncbi:lysosomal-trafficking regulator isoform X2 [Rhopalosiphum padi]|nr:lysosomal-trafficking regulator isoform X2 [Rhopalosiphum padi]
MDHSTPIKPSKILIFWEAYLKCNTIVENVLKNDFKIAWFDLLLSEILFVHEKIKKVPDDIPKANISNAIVDQLLLDIDHVCSVSGEEDLSSLKKYILIERGWRCLTVLHLFGTQEVRQLKELANVLVSIFSIFNDDADGKTSYDTKKINPYISPTDETNLKLDDLIKLTKFQGMKSKSKTQLNSIYDRSSPSIPRSRRVSSVSANRIKTHSLEGDKSKMVEESSESESQTALDMMKSPSTLRIRFNPMDFDYFTNIVRSEDEHNESDDEETNLAKRRNLYPGYFYDENIKSITNHTSTPSQIKLLVLDLLTQILLFGTQNPLKYNLKSSHQFVPFIVMKFSLDSICVSQFDVSNKDDDIIQSKMLYNMVLAVKKLYQYQNISETITQEGIVPLLLQILENLLNKSRINELKEYPLRQKTLFGVVCALLMLFSLMLFECHSYNSHFHFLKQIRVMLDCQRGKLIEKCISLILSVRDQDAELSTNHVKIIINLLGLLVLNMKKIRQRMVHLQHCNKTRHRHCIKSMLHHHNNLFGEVYVSSIVPSQDTSQNCCVTSLSMILIRLMINLDNQDKELWFYLAKTIGVIGICCCVPLSLILPKLLKMVGDHDYKKSYMILQLMEKTLYRDTGVAYKDNSCKVCCDDDNTSQSNMNSYEKNKKKKEQKWITFELFRKLLTGSSIKLSYTIGLHLSKNASVFIKDVQHVMLFRIFYPVFKTSEKSYRENKSDSDRFLINVSLNIFNILLASLDFTSEFDSLNGVKYLKVLITDPIFTKLSCNVLETKIMSKMWTLNQIKTTPILITDSQAEDLNIIVTAVFNLVELFCGYVMKPQTIKINLKFKYSLSALSDFLREDMTFKTVDQYNDYNSIITRLGDLFQCLARLSLTCPRIRSYLQVSSVVYHYDTLLSVVSLLLTRPISVEGMNVVTIEDKNVINLKLIECLLVLNLSIFEDKITLDSHIKDLLIEALSKGHIGIKQVCSSLIKCATVSYNRQALNSITTDQSLTTLLEIETPGKAEWLPFDDDDDFISGDEGYEADIEFQSWINIDSSDKTADESISHKNIHTDTKKLNIMHPALCTLAIDLMTFSRNLDNIDGIVYCLQRLIAICKDNDESCIKLAKEGLISKLLNCIKEHVNNNERSEIYDKIYIYMMELIALMACHYIETYELEMYLNLFKTHNPPLRLLLLPLVYLTDHIPIAWRPYYSIQFPAKVISDLPISDRPAEALAILIRENHKEMRLLTPWSVFALSLPINTDLGWSVLSTGFSLSMWLCLDYVHKCVNIKRNNSAESIGKTQNLQKEINNLDDLTHVFSIGFDAMLIEFWLNPLTDGFVVRLTRPNENKFELLSEVNFNNCLGLMAWHHVAINVNGIKKGDKFIEINLIIDGLCENKANLLFNGFLIKKPRPSNVLLGDTRDNTSLISIGNILMFRLPVLTKECASTLAAFGPDLENLADCSNNPLKPNFSMLFNDSVFNLNTSLNSNLDWNQIMKQSFEIIKPLQDVILLSFTPRQPLTVCLYSLTLPNPTGSLFPPTQPLMFKMTAYDLRACQSPPQVISTVIVSSIKVLEPNGLLTVVNKIGGMPLILFLFARVIEFHSSSNDQVKALQILLHFVQSDSKLYSEFITLDGYKLLTKALTSSKIQPSCSMLMVLLEAGCNKKGAFVYVNDEWIVNMFYEGVLLNTCFIKEVILPCWKIWTTKNQQIIQYLFKFCKHLLSLNHPHRKFNLKQIQSSELLESILLQIKCQLLLEDSNETTLIGCVQKDLVDFVQSIFDLRTNKSYITLILDFLIAVHPSKNLYLPHLKASVYFVLSPQSRMYISPDFHIHISSESEESDSKLNLNEYSETDFSGSIDTHKLNTELLKLQVRQELLKNNQIYSSKASEETSESSEHFVPEETGQDSGIDGSIKDVAIAMRNNEKNVSLDYGNACEAEVYFGAQEKLNEKQFEYSDSESHGEMIEGLLSILRNVLINISNCVPDNIIDKMFDAEKLVVLLNNPSPSVKIMILKIICVFLQRCSQSYAKKFVTKFKGFYQMANILSLHQTTVNLVDTCASIFTGSYWLPLDQQLQWDQSVEMGSFNFSAVPLLLSLLPKSTFNLTLCTNIVNFFLKLVTKVPQCLHIILEYGLVECLLKTLSVIASIYPTSQSHIDLNKQEILVDDINSLLITLITSAIHTPGIQNIQILNDSVYQCRYLQRTEIQTSKEGIRSNLTLRETQRFILESGMDTIQDLIQTQPPLVPALSRLKKNLSSVLSLNNPKETNDIQSISNSESSLFSIVSNSNRQKSLSKAELIDRYKNIIIRSVEFIFASNENTSDEVTPEVAFGCHLFTILLYNLTSIIQNTREQRQHPWVSIYGAARDVIRSQGANLLVWLLSPHQTTRIRIFAVKSLLNEPRSKELFKNLIYINPQIEQRFYVYLYSLMNADLTVALTEEEMCTCEALKEHLIELELLTADSNGIVYENEWKNQINQVLGQMNIELNGMDISQSDNIIKSACKWDNTIKLICNSAIAITSIVSDEQNSHRKLVLEKTKQNYRNTIQATIRWKSIINQMSHEKAPWYFPESYPTSWELNPTEGPSRVRIRLQRCHLNILKKFFKPEHSKKAEKNNIKGPLDYLVSDDMEVPVSSAVVESLLSQEKISYMCTAKLVHPWQKIKCEILISENAIYIVPTENISNFLQNDYSHVLKFDEIKEIHNRRYSLKEKAVEIFLTNGKTFLIAFHSQKERDEFGSYLLNFPLPNRITNEILSETVDLWRTRQITNMEYLSILNKMAARSYNDLMQYPVMPFVLASYNTMELDLNQLSTYRDLRRPMAIQNKKKEAHYIQHYNYLKEDIHHFGTDPHHYSSHYSNSGTILHFLIRVPPYTQMFIKYQDNNFDVPDRSFHSMEITWRLSSDESTTDLKELIPEFYYLPEMFMNFEQLNFGVKQSGEIVDSVKLPIWAQNNPRLFVLIQRQLLESEIVSENLPHWIDLIFGFKQTGKAAIDAINVFHPATYYGSHIEETEDPVARSAFKTMVSTYGQTPRQLFRFPHPMIVNDYSPKNVTKNTNCRNVIKGLKNLKWGNYVGSPEENVPMYIWKRKHKTLVTNFVPLLTNDVFGLSNNSALLLTYSKEKSLTLLNEGVTVMAAAILTWSEFDNVVRIKQRKEAPSKPAFKFFSTDNISTIVTAPHCPYVWIGFESGIIHVYKFYFDIIVGNVEIFKEPTVLVGHRAKVSCIALSPAFSIAVSCDNEGTAIIWDLNDIAYVRSLEPMMSPINLVSINEILGDIVTIAYNYNSGKSIMTLQTINASHIGSIESDKKITAVCFSNAPEGISVNIIATGLEDGSVKLWSTWDLSFVNEIPIIHFDGAVIAIIYSSDSQHLYISTEDGTVTIWESAGAKQISKTPKFLNLSI